MLCLNLAILKLSDYPKLIPEVLRLVNGKKLHVKGQGMWAELHSRGVISQNILKALWKLREREDDESSLNPKSQTNSHSSHPGSIPQVNEDFFFFFPLGVKDCLSLQIFIFLSCWLKILSNQLNSNLPSTKLAKIQKKVPHRHHYQGHLWSWVSAAVTMTLHNQIAELFSRKGASLIFRKFCEPKEGEP